MLAAISSMSRYEVLVASTAPGLQTRSSSANTAFLTAMSSNTASTTRSASPKAAYEVEPLKRVITRGFVVGASGGPWPSSAS